MYYGNQSLVDDLSKYQALNKHFSSVLNTKRPVFFQIFLDYFDFSVTDIELLLNDCDDSLATGPEKIPSFV